MGFLPENTTVQWVDIPGYEGMYKISSQGEVESCPRKMWNGRVWWYSKSRILKYGSALGYLTVGLTKDCKTKTFLIHRLLAELFIPNPHNKAQVNHIDGVKTNNSLNNLEWVTCRENIRHAFKNGLNRGTSLCGKDNPASKLSRKQVREIRRLRRKEPLKITADRFGVSVSQVSVIQNYKSWTHIK